MTILEAIRLNIKVTHPSINGVVDCSGVALRWLDGSGTLTHTEYGDLSQYDNFELYVETKTISQSIILGCDYKPDDTVILFKCSDSFLLQTIVGDNVYPITLSDKSIDEILDFLCSHGNPRICPF